MNPTCDNEFCPECYSVHLQNEVFPDVAVKITCPGVISMVNKVQPGTPEWVPDGRYWLDCSIDSIEVTVVEGNVFTVCDADREILRCGVVGFVDERHVINRLRLTPRTGRPIE